MVIVHPDHEDYFFLVMGTFDRHVDGEHGCDNWEIEERRLAGVDNVFHFGLNVRFCIMEMDNALIRILFRGSRVVGCGDINIIKKRVHGRIKFLNVQYTEKIIQILKIQGIKFQPPVILFFCRKKTYSVSFLVAIVQDTP